MAILRAEGFHHFDNFSDWAAKGHNGGGVNSFVLPIGGPNGRGCLSLGTNNDAHCVLPRAVTTLYAHVRFYIPARVVNQNLFEFRSGTATHILFLGAEDGAMTIYQCNPPFNGAPFDLVSINAIGQTAPESYRAGVWHHAQIKVTISTTVGEVWVKVDGVEVAHLQNVYTYGNSGFATISQFGMGGCPVANQRYADLVLVDEVATDAFDNATPYTGFIGDQAVYEFVDPVDGDLLEWTRSGGVGTFASYVNQNPQDGDATYLSSSATAQKMSFSFPDVVTGASITAIKNTVCHRKDASGFAVLRLLSRSDDAINHFSSQISTTESYKFDEIIADVDPKDGAAWTEARRLVTQLGFEHFA